MGLEEDLGSGDITTESIITDDHPLKVRAVAREPLVLCGGNIFRTVFATLDPSATFQTSFQDGDQVSEGAVLFQVSANCAALLKGERTALNILQRLSGIATLTRRFVERAGSVTILDTRKTTPGLRVFEKYAVACGGGKNHRFGLFDAVLVKDNHIKAAGGISRAVALVRKNLDPSLKIEVETSNLDEVEEALRAGVEVVMLDNMALEAIRKAAKKAHGKAHIEVSGLVTLDRMEELAAAGIDSVSVGALTHSAKAVDISMNIINHS